MQFIDNPEVVKQLHPFSMVRSVADIRLGITTIREKWMNIPGCDDKKIPSNLLPTPNIVNLIKNGNDHFPADALFIEHPWHIFQFNDQAIRLDFEILKTLKVSQPLSATNRVTEPGNIFLEEGARVEHCFLNASAGPIYIGKNAEIMEGSMIRGPFALCEGSLVKMGSKIYGATTVGPYSIVGGEIKNSVIFGYSNKAHDGYLGDAVIAEWCNLGAGTSNSNLKNNASTVKVWNASENKYIPAGLKCGLLMGDYSRSSINTSFNTGTVVGVCCNVFGQGLTPTYIPSFTWGYESSCRYSLDKALRDIQNWKKLKNQILTEEEIKKLNSIFET